MFEVVIGEWHFQMFLEVVMSSKIAISQRVLCLKESCPKYTECVLRCCSIRSTPSTLSSYFEYYDEAKHSESDWCSASSEYTECVLHHLSTRITPSIATSITKKKRTSTAEAIVVLRVVPSTPSVYSLVVAVAWRDFCTLRVHERRRSEEVVVLRVLRVGTLTSNIVVLWVQRGSDCTQSTESKESIVVEIRVRIVGLQGRRGSKEEDAIVVLSVLRVQRVRLILIILWVQWGRKKATLTTKDALDVVVVLGEQRDVHISPNDVWFSPTTSCVLCWSKMFTQWLDVSAVKGTWGTSHRPP